MIILCILILVALPTLGCLSSDGNTSDLSGTHASGTGGCPIGAPGILGPLEMGLKHSVDAKFMFHAYVDPETRNLLDDIMPNKATFADCFQTGPVIGHNMYRAVCFLKPQN